MKFLVSGHGSIRDSIKFGFQIWCVGVTKLECVTGEGRARERIWLYERLRSNDFETRGRVASTRLNFPFLFLHQLYALRLPMAGHTESVLPLHVIDLAENDRHLLAQKVKKACLEHGFFYLINHGIDLKLIDKVFEQSKLFFDLPVDEKMRSLQDNNYRGYVPIGKETLNPIESKQGDSREAYFIGWEMSEDHPLALKPLHGPNQWPSKDLLPEWRETLETYFYKLLEVGHCVASLVALALDLEADYFRHMFMAPAVALRPLHYIGEISCPEEGRFGTGPHGDYGMLTFLATDENRGLQVCRARDGEPKLWEDVPPKKESFIVNLGDMLERWTNGLFKSTQHRVVTDGIDRYSVAYFYDPDYDTVIECLPTCHSEEFPPNYPPITMGDYFKMKFTSRAQGSSNMNSTPI
ncbi:protein MpDOXC23 [Marchantia polymorpha subsp. ruderalis]